MSTRGAATFQGVIRFHRKSRTGCLTCRKRKVKCDEATPICRNCHRRELVCVPRPKIEHNQQGSALYKPLTSPVPSSFTVDATSLQIFHHYMAVTSYSLCTNPNYMAESIPLLPQLLFNNPVTMHAALAFTALHLGRLYEPSSSSSSQNWLARASAHRNAAIGLIQSPSLNTSAHFLTVGSLSVYAIFLLLSSPSSSPENIFSLVTLLHNVWSSMNQLVYTNLWLQGLDFARPGPLVASSALGTGTDFLAPLHHLYDTSMDLNLDLEELDDPDVREAYRTAVLGLCVAYSFIQTGYEARGAMFWPTLTGKKFVGLLNKRRQRALVVLYYFLMILRNLRERCWWASEVGRWVDYVYGLIDERWRNWLREIIAKKGRVIIKKDSVH
uniref:Zn(2)-C6 fungal-type domain-containing protein n=1 Tax=Moniliophthora roreri TaxID=221103 RepID=A0A0W0GC46_MONRR